MKLNETVNDVFVIGFERPFSIELFNKINSPFKSIVIESCIYSHNIHVINIMLNEHVVRFGVLFLFVYLLKFIS